MHLNLSRIQAQHEVVVANGVSTGMSDEDVDLGFADAIARHPEEADTILHKITFARMAARMKAGKK